MLVKMRRDGIDSTKFKRKRVECVIAILILTRRHQTPKQVYKTVLITHQRRYDGRNEYDYYSERRAHKIS